jgi:hypothetical protein
MAQSVGEEHKPMLKADAFDLTKEIAALDSSGRLLDHLATAAAPAPAAPTVTLSVKPPVGAPPITVPNPNARDSKGVPSVRLGFG